MVLDPPPASPPQTRNPSLDVQPGGLSVPSFHYPQRQKILPLAVVPDPNRGIPGVPAVPAQFAGNARGRVKSGSFCFGTPGENGFGDQMSGRDSGLGGMRDEKENCGVY
jgi:hypothetical protein